MDKKIIDTIDRQDLLIKELRGFRTQNLKEKSDQTTPDADSLNFEILLSGLSAKFSKLNPKEVDSEIENGLRLLIEFLNLDRSTLFKLDIENKRFIAKYSYAGKGIKRITTQFGTEVFPYTWETLQKGELVQFAEYKDLPPNANVDLVNYKKFDLKSGYIVPILIDGIVKYALSGGITSKDYHHWPASLLPRIQLIGEIFANAIERSKYLKRLEEVIIMNQKLTTELNRFLPTKLTNNDFKKSTKQTASRSRKKTWLGEGVSYFAESGRVDLNRICERMGLAKTSFYNKYPTFEGNKGLDRYRKEILDHTFTQLSTFFNKATHLIKKESADNINVQVVDLAFSDCIYLQSLGQIVINKSDPYIGMIAEKLNLELENLVSFWLDKVSEKKVLSVLERKEIQGVIVTNIYHQSLVLKPEKWKDQIISVLEQITSIIKS